MSFCSKKVSSKKSVSIGGQAVIEGVMMRGKTAMSTAVRDQDGIIRTESKRIKPASERNILFRLPFVRGVIAFVQSLFGGTKVLMRSAEVYGEGEPSKFERWLAKTFKVNVMSVVSTLSLIIALGLAIFLFMWLPQFLRERIEIWAKFSLKDYVWAKNFIEGGIKLLIFISYILLCTLIKDVRRTFMYHGAEHKVISCYEKGAPLTTENAKKCTRIHDRCGTTFMVFVIVISILCSAVAESLIGANVEKLYRVLLKIALLPIVAGISYELLKVLAKTNSFLVYPLKLPGMLLQKITTREPDEKMLEVAITAFNNVLEMDKDQSLPETEFIVSKKRAEVVASVKETLEKNGISEQAEAEWIVSIVLDVKRSELYTDDIVSPLNIEKINNIVNERIKNRPLWYCVGDTDFYGYKINVDERVLIPRPETELLVENVLKITNENSAVLDLCTGSGAIAIAIKKQSHAKVSAIDISEDALIVARKNAEENSADIEFIKSNLFDKIIDRKFDVIVSNPPYIKSADIEHLQAEVKDYEPLIALDGGVDGLDFYREIAKKSAKHLNKGGVLLLECGIGQADNVANELVDFTSVDIIKDYEGIDRIIKAVL